MIYEHCMVGNMLNGLLGHFQGVCFTNSFCYISHDHILLYLINIESPKDLFSIMVIFQCLCHEFFISFINAILLKVLMSLQYVR